MARRDREPLTEMQRRKRVLVSVVALLVIVALAITGVALGWATRPADTAAPTTSPGGTSVPSAVPSGGPTAAPSGDPAEQAAAAKGWLPELLTEDPRAYGEQAAIALATYDTTLATRADLVSYLATWHTIDTRFASEADRQASLESAIQQISQYMIPPVATWDEQALSKTVLTAKVIGSKMDKELLAFANDPLSTDGQHIVTTEIAVTTSAEDRSTGQRNEFDQRFTITVRIMCGNAVPPVDSKGSPSRCMILNYINDPIL